MAFSMDHRRKSLHLSTPDWRRAQVEPALCGRLRCGAGWQREPGVSERLTDHELWLVWAGRGAMQTHAGDFVLRPGFVAWMRPGGIYEAQTDPIDRLGITFCHFDLYRRHGGRRVKLDPRTSAGREFFELTDLAYADNLTRRVVELTREPFTPPDAARDAARALLAGLLTDLAGVEAPLHADTAPTRTMRRIAATMRDRPDEIPPVPELAERAGYSPSHFQALFREAMGVSPRPYAISARIDRARQLLIESDLSVSQIASECGYRDVYFFSRQFRQKTGRPPTAYRRRPG